MRIIVLILIISVSMGIMKSYAEDDQSFGVRIIPQKIMENSEGILQVYALHNNHIYPQKIENMIFSSTDSSIVQVIAMENNNNDYITNIKLKTLNPGNAKIVLGASGFPSKEVPITVYESTRHLVKLLVQSTPSTFSINGPNAGFFTVELINSNGSPEMAKDDMFINLTTTDSRVISMLDTHIIIRTGEYYGIGKFEVKQVGVAQIFASANSLESASATITVIPSSSPTIQMYTYPAKINNYAASISYVVAQLKDSSGVLTPAQKDITIPVSVVDPNANLTNSSPIVPNIEANAPITIKKGSYWGYTNLSVKAGKNGTYNVFISAPDGYGTSGKSTVTTLTTKFYDDKSAKLDVLPVLATGKKELIGILHLEDKNGNPIIASHDLEIEIDSSDSYALKVDKVILNKGYGVALVYGNTGNIIPSSISLHVVTYNDQTVSPIISLPTSESLKLVAQSLVPKVLSHSIFPIAVYQTDSSNALTGFASDSVLSALPNDQFSIQHAEIHKNDSIIIVNSTSLKDGTSSMTMIAGNHQTSLTLETTTPSQTANGLHSQISLDYTTPILFNLPNTLVVQILDSNSNPGVTQKDITLKLLSSNTTVFPLPENITISKGKYYTTFTVNPNSTGTSQVSILSDDLSLATYKIMVDSFSPTLSVTIPDSVQFGQKFIASVRAQDHGIPLKNMKMQWKVNGATIQSSDSITNQNGTANIVLLPNAGNRVILYANTTGLGYLPTYASKITRVNGTGLNSFESNSTNSNSTKSNLPPSSDKLQSILKSFKINGIDTLPIFVLSAIAMSGILMKKRNFTSFKRKANPSKI